MDRFFKFRCGSKSCKKDEIYSKSNITIEKLKELHENNEISFEKEIKIMIQIFSLQK
jgi:hypothetical protein